MTKSQNLAMMIGCCLHSFTPLVIAQEEALPNNLTVPFVTTPSEAQIPLVIYPASENAPSPVVSAPSPTSMDQLPVTSSNNQTPDSSPPLPIPPRPIWPATPLSIEIQPSPTVVNQSASPPDASLEPALSDPQTAVKSEALEALEALQVEIEALKLEVANLSQQNLLQAEKNKGTLLELQLEKDKLALENDVRHEQNRQTLAKLSAEKDKLLLENDLQTARQIQLRAELEAQKVRLELENTIIELKQTKLKADLESERAMLATKNAVLEEKNKRQELEIHLASTKLEFEKSKLEFEKAKKSLNLEELTEKIEERNRKQEWESQVNKPVEYLKDPYQNGHLTISDRRIELPDWIILPGMASYVLERIHYFNNKSTEHPIFLVIDYCEGGDVQEGGHILEAMQNSQAPVYVVVKTMAASMCAVLTTLAKRSFAYPNAVIVHHQIWTFAFGNKVQLEEQLEDTQKWTQRILQPVAEKMGLSMGEFVTQMYEHNSNGDWSEFADDAVNLKWVDTVVQDIRDSSYILQPPTGNPNDEEDDDDDDGEDLMKVRVSKLRAKTDEQGQRYVQLPPARPKGFYFLYNPHNYYRY